MVTIIIIIEKIVVLLPDSDWHKLKEINKEIPVLTHQLEESTLFLRESFINKENEIKNNKQGASIV